MQLKSKAVTTMLVILFLGSGIGPLSAQELTPIQKGAFNAGVFNTIRAVCPEIILPTDLREFIIQQTQKTAENGMLAPYYERGMNLVIDGVRTKGPKEYCPTAALAVYEANKIMGGS